ncbi:hypothetical protein Tco_0449056 [Tanacetum coccineum]
MAKLLAKNEKLNKENEHLKQSYKKLYDSIKKKRIQTKYHNDSLIAQVNSKTVENADLKAQIHEKVFANAALKNELRKLKGNSKNTMFAKPSILGNLVLQPLRNQSVVRQPTAFRSERPKFSKPQFASQVDVKNDLPKPVTPHYLPKVRESVFVNLIMFSPNKSSDVHKEPNTPRSCLRWKPTGRIFKFVGLRWIPTGKMFTDSTTKVDSEPPNGSNDDITNPYECDQTLNVSAGTLNLSAGPRPQLMTPGTINLGLVQNIPSPTPAVPPTKIDRDLLFQAMFDEYFKAPPNVDHPVPDIPTLVPAASTSSPSSTTVDQDAPSTSTSQTTSEQQSSVIPQGVEDDFYDIEVAHMDNDPYFGILIPEPSSEETTLQGVIPSNLHHLNQSFDTLTKLTKKHPLDNVIGDPSQLVSTRS